MQIADGSEIVGGRRTQSCRPRILASGFTLVELLVVIGIIALLISILLPSLNAAQLPRSGLNA